MLLESIPPRDEGRNEIEKCPICYENVCKGQQCLTGAEVKDCPVVQELKGQYGLHDPKNSNE